MAISTTTMHLLQLATTALLLLLSITNPINGFTTTSPTRVVVAGNKLNTMQRMLHNTMIAQRTADADADADADETRTNTALYMARPPKKKRRRRKTAPTDGSGDNDQVVEMPFIPEDDMQAIKELSSSSSSGGGDKKQPTLEEIRAIANFQAPKSGAAGGNTNQDALLSSPIEEETLADLPDIRNVFKNKEMKKIEEEEAQKRVRKRISRKDTKAFLELLEAEPFADTDPDFFEEEEYGTVSALLGEGAKSFLGIPPGPLQVGHFIGSLGIVLCAFIEYPGFPLTNLPSPLRDALQGGLGVIYLINAGLAALAVFKASERGQNPVLWGIKTFSIGGLALDQLTQLPTLKEVEALANVKGARAVKKKK